MQLEGLCKIILPTVGAPSTDSARTRNSHQLAGAVPGVPIQDYCNGGTFREIVHSLNGRMGPHSGQEVAVY